MIEIPFFRPFGEPCNTKVVTDQDGYDYLIKYLKFGGDFTPSFDEKELQGIWLSDSITPRRKFRNKKNGKTYVVRSKITNATNGQNDQEMYLYYAEDNPLKQYARNVLEFNEKFDEIKQS